MFQAWSTELFGKRQERTQALSWDEHSPGAGESQDLKESFCSGKVFRIALSEGAPGAW